MNHSSSHERSRATTPESAATLGPRVRVLCVDDEPALTRVLGKLLNMESDLECVGELESADRLVEEVMQRRADVVLLDLTMPGCNSVEAIRALVARVPCCRVLVFSGYDDQQTQDEVRRAGAFGLVSKSASPDNVLAAIRKAGASVRPVVVPISARGPAAGI